MTSDKSTKFNTLINTGFATVSSGTYLAVEE